MKAKLTKKTMMLSATLGLVIWLLAVSVNAQSDASKPGPEIKKLEVFVGDWRYEGEQFDPPFAGLPYGGAGKYFGTATTRFILNGFFLESKVEDNNPAGKTSIILITGYDATAKGYVENMYQSEGARSVATASLDGQTYTLASTMTTATGKKVLLKTVVKYAPDWSHYTGSTEASVDDGKTWKPWWKEEGRKVKK